MLIPFIILKHAFERWELSEKNKEKAVEGSKTIRIDKRRYGWRLSPTTKFQCHVIDLFDQG